MAGEVAGPIAEVPGWDGATSAVNQNDGRMPPGAPRHRDGAGEPNGAVLERHVFTHVIIQAGGLASAGTHAPAR